MKLDVTFAGNAQEIPAAMHGQSRTFSSGFAGTTFIHDGQNGATFTPAVSENGIISWTNDRELPNPDPVNIKGADGVGVARVYLKTIGMGDGATSTYVVELTDSSIGGTISVKNGSKGDKGDRGERGIQGEPGVKGDKGDKGDQGERGLRGLQGIQGIPGTAGKDGAQGDRGPQGIQGPQGVAGPQGPAGKDGADGRTPVAGVDYFTAAEKAEMVAAVRAQLITEQWTFTLSDGTTVTKDVVVE